MAILTTYSIRKALGRQLRLLRQGQNARCNSKTTCNPKIKGGLTDAANVRGADPVPVPAPNTAAAGLPFWQRLGPLTRAVEAYGRTQRKRPYLTQFCSAIAIYLTADVSAQRINGKEYDLWRTVRSLTIGGLAAIPSFKWFVWLAQSFNYSSRLLSVATKVVVNQICFVPVFNSYFFGMQALLAGDNMQQTADHVKRTVPTSFVNSCKLWPAVTAINFAFIPLEYRSIFAGGVAVGWQTYLSFLNRQAEIQAQKARASQVGEVKAMASGRVQKMGV